MGTLVRPDCDYNAQPVADADDSELGVSADDLLAYAEGEFATDIEWPDDPYAQVSYSTEDAGGVRLVVRRRKGSASYLSTASDAGARSDCPPTLSVPVEVSVETDGGALDETFDTELRASSADLATFVATIDAERLSGTLRVASVSADYEFDSVTLSGFVSAFGTAGFVEANSATGPGDEVTTRAAHWPSEGCAPDVRFGQPELSLDDNANIDGRDFASLRSAAQALSPVPLRWSDGSETELSLTVDGPSRVCLREQQGAARLRAAVDLGLSSADGRLEGRLPGLLVDQSAAGQPMWLVVSAQAELGPREFAQTLSLDGFDPGDFELVQANLWLDAGDVPTGGFTVLGLSACQGAPDVEPEPALGCEYAPLFDAGLGEFDAARSEPIVP
jgi:hypothetical protein